jgi:hypothetical protein
MLYAATLQPPGMEMISEGTKCIFSEPLLQWRECSSSGNREPLPRRMDSSNMLHRMSDLAVLTAVANSLRSALKIFPFSGCC